MVSLNIIDEQLRQTGHRIGLWGRSEIRELCNILLPGEEITDCVNGHYFNGFALLCATNQRIILVDVKPMFMTLEDIRYDMIAGIDYSHRLFDSTVKIFTPTKKLYFTSWNVTRLRRLAMNSQKHVLAIRQFQANNTFTSNLNYQNLQNIGQTNTLRSQPVTLEKANYVSNIEQPLPLTKNAMNNLSLAALAVNSSLSSKDSDITEVMRNPLPAINNGIAYPANSFVKNSFTYRNRSWPRKGLIPKR